jgi:hypothetical protein
MSDYCEQHETNHLDLIDPQRLSCPDCEHERLNSRIAELEANLDRVRGLPDEWRDISYKTTDAYTNLHGCADELQSALGEDDE